MTGARGRRRGCWCREGRRGASGGRPGRRCRGVMTGVSCGSQGVFLNCECAPRRPPWWPGGTGHQRVGGGPAVDGVAWSAPGKEEARKGASGRTRGCWCRGGEEAHQRWAARPQVSRCADRRQLRQPGCLFQQRVHPPVAAVVAGGIAQQRAGGAPVERGEPEAPSPAPSTGG